VLDYLAGIQHRPVITIDVDKPTSGEQRNIWENALGSVTSDLNSNVDALVSQYSMSTIAIHNACADELSSMASSDDGNPNDSNGLGRLLWDACRVHNPGPGMIKTKLKINEPRDIYEQEADRVAELVMQLKLIY
jgi:hypothetical protein